MNRLFVAYKPAGIGSNLFLSRIKREYKTKKAGFSGTLDPFAKGVLIIGMGSYTKLFRFLAKAPKVYRATLWLGAKSDTLDTEMIEEVEILEEFDEADVLKAIKSLEGSLEYEPPIFSAKQINGQRAYDLARAGVEFSLNKINSTIYETKLVSYCHPFVTFEAIVSEGTYIRSLGLIIANRLGVKNGSLSALERLSEGRFKYDNHKPLDIKKSLNMMQNFYHGDSDNLKYGRVLALNDLEIKSDGFYWLDSGSFISIIHVKDAKVNYELGRIEC
ncbi:tRNA pseudouridine synthase B [Sulfurimonas denitrificans DSM 1251]|jgi:tRNA pseudouridine55 synthase|uniref:tRNA pseudouridine synthase B n=1 Tax=Sulfurimonas denitrificans (strain ATCC 33889 / DSM 1251) TaxID=326298 RepID=TRUB_SULDN|nr:tRNA pseudouridine(55) synthase TruB [Sulfurimonas denitrificans]Q30TG2.1 RecName: Full=tRNA pseudouridine synthase B; AltName: Full=tRNA pseudouridine(55) synthase; Short=Psi55 synthase; AltName: Full=tRNA pseudouridylate synthase; AltName: Full=tRNA-uridine isomerase [Sulfurimonas denitrificans DSM 1251]ABB43719.1 tRNA pseudouridine synthase B [Sulfurimonas denitrificans DSM 1251]MDD3442742.1 tRNA pseudouridine(55) synthase TruB [Sulfurimonas denitrificans]